ncbi:hypothetical protein HK107_03595 [Parvularcula sp. ZS-1/3]|uniref:Lipoprotein n=1 Tax=Parvularcula mediterranea TaxID=2732508 RepID=A0A7Y3W4N0_9PROT|nr:hypothetical protein [Parvularcula mediterranea]NNU15411.1 hypothetical protein [Parvularcula mediterranea]
MIRTLIASVAALTAASCASIGAQEAVLLPGAVEGAKAKAAAALGRASIELGKPDPTEQSQFIVLPPRLGSGEDRSLAKPQVFVIMLDGGECVLYDGKMDPISLGEGVCKPA